VNDACYTPHPYWTILEIVVSPILLVSLLFTKWGRNNKTSLIPPFVIEVLVASHKSERSCMCVRFSVNGHVCVLGFSERSCMCVRFSVNGHVCVLGFQ